jgi:ribonuclease Z
MPTLHLLGTGAALSGASRTTTMLAFSSTGSTVMVDCGGDAFQRLLAAGVDPDTLSALILTHQHADHVAGFPLLMERLWLSGRRRPLVVCGPGGALQQARRVFEAFDTSGWKGLPEIDWCTIPLDEGAKVWTDDKWRITGAPGHHGVPVLALRVEDSYGGGVAAYSSDTSRSDEVARLAQAADILVHEATGDSPGHTSPQDAAHVARQAGVGRLILVHLPAEIAAEDLDEARASFPALEVGEDGAAYQF